MSKIMVSGIEIETERHAVTQKEEKAYLELKNKIVKEMFAFSDKYSAKGEDCLYPQCGQILIDVLQACLNEAQAHMGIYKAVKE